VLDSSPYAEIKHRTTNSLYDTIKTIELGFSRKTNTDMHDLKVVILKSSKQIRIWVDGIQRFETGTNILMAWPDSATPVHWEFGHWGFATQMSNLVVYASDISSTPGCLACRLGWGSVYPSPCTMCEAGKFSEKHMCIDCPSDTFSATIGADASDKCLQCPTNTISSPGTTSRDGCVCRSGYERDPLSTTITCKICPTGSYKDIGDTVCILCEPGKYTSGSGASTCLSCQFGTPGHTNRGEDCSCNAGAQGPKGGPCTLCIIGTYKDSTSSGVEKI